MSVRILATMALLVTLSGCQWGAPPRIPYVDGTTYVEPDGHREQLTGQQKEGVSAIAPLHGGHLVADTFFFEGYVGLSSLVNGVRTRLGPCATGAGVVSDDGDRVAWLTMGCPESNQTGPTVVHVGSTSRPGGWSRSLGRQFQFFAVGFLGDAVVISSWTGQVLVVPELGPMTAVPHLSHAVDAHGTLVAGRQSVVDTTTGRLLWHEGRTWLISFSPNGRLLVGLRRRSPVILETRTGRVVASLPRRLDRLTWENDRHLLAVAWGKGKEAIVRIGLDGHAMLVSSVQPVPPRQPYRYVFETQP